MKSERRRETNGKFSRCDERKVFCVPRSRNEERGKKSATRCGRQTVASASVFFLSSSDIARLCFAIPKAKEKKKKLQPQHMCATCLSWASVFFFPFPPLPACLFHFCCIKKTSTASLYNPKAKCAHTRTHLPTTSTKGRKTGDLRMK